MPEYRKLRQAVKGIPPLGRKKRQAWKERNALINEVRKLSKKACILEGPF